MPVRPAPAISFSGTERDDANTMLDPVHDECGVAAVYRLGKIAAVGFESPLSGGNNVAHLIPPMLTDLQNRGQLAAGITSYNPERKSILATRKDNGTVGEVFRMNHEGKYRNILRENAGRAAIGHVRYATCGRDDPGYAQPFECPNGFKWKWFAFCFNGNIANYSECRQRILENRDYHLVRETDTEIIQHQLFIAFEGPRKPDLVDVFRHLSESFDGAYSMALLTADGDLVVARDPHGFRPLCYAVREGELFAAASESLPLDRLGFEVEEIHSVEPGTLVHVTEDGCRVRRFAESPRKAYCFFEWVYFSNVGSVINDRSVYASRRKTGEALARGETESIDDNCVVVPVPDTARAAADAMAATLGIPTFEGLLRNRYLGRTFIEGSSRAEKARRKYSPIPEILEGKRVFLVEDSIVRSTTLRVIIEMIRERARASEVHVRVACPPIMAPCSYGIDMSTVRELFAPRFMDEPVRGEIPPDLLDRLAADLGADSLRYLTIDALPECIGLSENSLCLACLTGEYPTPWGKRLYELARESPETAGRTYERGLVEPVPE